MSDKPPFSLEMTPEERHQKLVNLADDEIDYSDIPELSEEFWESAEVIEPDRTQPVTLRIKRSVLEYFQAEGKKGYQSRINAVLESYVKTKQKS